MENKQEFRFIVTQNCNYDCTFCHKEGCEGEEKNLLNTNDYNFLYNLGKNERDMQTCSLTGGEPLTRPDIIDIAKNLKQQGAQITMISNGRLLEKKYEICKDLERINISLHSLQKDLYQNMTRTKNTPEEIMDILKNIKKQYPHIEMRTNNAVIKNINDSDQEINKHIDFIKSINGSIKYIELYPAFSEGFLPIEILQKKLQKKGFFIKEENIRKKILRDGQTKIILMKIGKENQNSNFKDDIFIKPNGEIQINREQNLSFNNYQDIKNKNGDTIKNKILKHKLLNQSYVLSSSPLSC